MTSGSNELDNRIIAIFQQVFQASPEALTDSARRGELPRWDSLGHLELIASLEREFQIEVPADDALTMDTVGDVKQKVARLCQGKSPAA